MSLLSLASVAIARDLADEGQPLAKDATIPKMRVLAVGGAGQPTSGGAAGPPGQPGTGGPDGGEATAGTVASFAQLLVAQIPSEALLAYTTLLALFSIAGHGYNIGRWCLYLAAIAVCGGAVVGSYVAQRNFAFDDTQPAPVPGTASTPLAAAPAATGQKGPVAKHHLPYLPLLSAVLSMAFYGLTVPGSALQYAVSGNAFAIFSGCLAVGGGVVMSILAPFLGKGNAAKAVAQQPVSASAPAPTLAR